MGEQPDVAGPDVVGPDVVGMVAGGALVVGAAGALCQRVLHVGPRACLLRTAVGIPCPLCGLSTAGVRLLHLDVAGAVRSDPLAVLLLAVAAAVAVGALLRWWRPRVAVMVRVPRPGGWAAWAVPGSLLAAHWIATMTGVVHLATLPG